jgi:hydrogenase maturation factor
MEAFPDTGKIQNSFFKSRVFPYCGAQRSDVVVGPEYGVDVSIVNLNNGLAMAMTSDPLSLIPTLGLQESAWISVQLMANDMATTGFAPMYAQFVLNLPTSLSADDFEQYWKYIHEYCQRLGIAITGGHTGRFDGLNSTVSGGGTMITIAPGEDIITSKGAMPGDLLVMTKECALISTAILGLSFPETIKNACGNSLHEQACNLFYETSAVEAGLAAGIIARHSKNVTALHDVTECGVMGAIYELTQASGCGVVIDETKIPVGDAQQKICNHFNIDPKYCVGAGSMIITIKPESVQLLLSQLESKKIKASIIGKITEANKGLVIRNNEGESPLLPNAVDPYWGAFFHAFKQGWK